MSIIFEGPGKGQNTAKYFICITKVRFLDKSFMVMVVKVGSRQPLVTNPLIRQRGRLPNWDQNVRGQATSHGTIYFAQSTKSGKWK